MKIRGKLSEIETGRITEGVVNRAHRRHKTVQLACVRDIGTYSLKVTA